MSRNSISNVAWLKYNGMIIEVIPNTRPILAILEPTALPILKLGCPLKAAVTDTVSSGAEVAKPTTTNPTTRVGIRKHIDKSTAVDDLSAEKVSKN